MKPSNCDEFTILYSNTTDISIVISYLADRMPYMCCGYDNSLLIPMIARTSFRNYSIIQHVVWMMTAFQKYINWSHGRILFIRNRDMTYIYFGYDNRLLIHMVAMKPLGQVIIHIQSFGILNKNYSDNEIKKKEE